MKPRTSDESKLQAHEDKQEEKTFPQYVNLLPPLQQLVLSNLSPREVARVAPSSQFMRRLVNSPHRWQQYLLQNGPLIKVREITDPKKFYASHPEHWTEEDLLESLHHQRVSKYFSSHFKTLTNRLAVQGISAEQTGILLQHYEIFNQANAKLLNLTQEEADCFCEAIGFVDYESKKHAGPAFRKIVTEKAITLQRFFRFSTEERQTFLLFLCHEGLEALRDNVITIDRFFSYSEEDQRDLAKFLFTAGGVKLIKAGVLTIDTFLSYAPKFRYHFLKLQKFTHTSYQALEAQGISLIEFLNYEEMDQDDIIALLSSESGLDALNRNFITIRDFLLLSHQDRSSITNKLFSSNGIRALEAKLVDTSFFLRYPNREAFNELFTAEMVHALREKIITVIDFLNLPRLDREALVKLCTTAGVREVKKGNISLGQFLSASEDTRFIICLAIKYDLLKRIPLKIILNISSEEFSQIRRCFFSEENYLCQKLLDRGLVTFDEFLKFSPTQKMKFSALDLTACEDIILGKKSVQDFVNSIFPGVKPLTLPGTAEIKAVIPPEGKLARCEEKRTRSEEKLVAREEKLTARDITFLNGAIEKGYITREEYLAFRPFEKWDCRYLFTANGYEALNAGLITVKQFFAVPAASRRGFERLLTPGGIEALKRGLFSIDRFFKMPPDQFHDYECLLSPAGIKALKERRITIEQFIATRRMDREALVNQERVQLPSLSSLSSLFSPVTHSHEAKGSVAGPTAKPF